MPNFSLFAMPRTSWNIIISDGQVAGELIIKQLSLKLTYLQDELNVCWHTRMMSNLTADILTSWNTCSWHTCQLQYLQTDILASWHDCKLTCLQVDKFSSWYTYKMTYLQADILTSWHTCKLIYLQTYILLKIIYLQADIIASWHMCKLIHLQPDTLSNWHTFKLIYLKADILGSWHTWKLTYLEADILGSWHTWKRLNLIFNADQLFCVLKFCQLGLKWPYSQSAGIVLLSPCDPKAPRSPPPNQLVKIEPKSSHVKLSKDLAQLSPSLFSFMTHLIKHQNYITPTYNLICS